MIWKKWKIIVEQKPFQKRVTGKWEKVNLRQTANQFSIKIWQLYYKESRLVIADKDLQVDIIPDINEGLRRY